MGHTVGMTQYGVDCQCAAKNPMKDGPGNVVRGQTIEYKTLSARSTVPHDVTSEHASESAPRGAPARDAVRSGANLRIRMANAILPTSLPYQDILHVGYSTAPRYLYCTRT